MKGWSPTGRWSGVMRSTVHRRSGSDPLVGTIDGAGKREFPLSLPPQWLESLLSAEKIAGAGRRESPLSLPPQWS